MIAVDDVVGAHVLQVDPLLFEELQGLVHVLQTVDAHPAFSGFGLQRKRDRKSKRGNKSTLNKSDYRRFHK